MKIMIVHPKIRQIQNNFGKDQKSRNLVLDFILYFVTTYIIIRKYPIRIT